MGDVFMRSKILNKMKKYPVRNYWYKKLTEEEKEYFDTSMKLIEHESLVLKKAYFISSPEEIPKKCPICGKDILKWYKDKSKYHINVFCSKECRKTKKSNEIILKKRKKTNLKKYGNENRTIKKS